MGKKENKIRDFRVRVKESELKQVLKEADNLGFKDNLSEFLRRKILRKSNVTVNPNKLIDELYLLRSELNKIGSNLNQVAHYTNSLVKNNIVDHKHIKELREIQFAFEINISKLKKKIDRTIDTI